MYIHIHVYIRHTTVLMHIYGRFMYKYDKNMYIIAYAYGIYMNIPYMYTCIRHMYNYTDICQTTIGVQYYSYMPN